jgi:thiol-disulfide isomerase/thioredoxin
MNCLLAQVTIKGRTNYKTDQLEVFEIEDYITNTERKIRTVSVDSAGLFAFELPINEIKKIVLRDKKRYSWLYVEPKARYFIQLPLVDSTSSNFLRDNEVEMEFFYLDSNDINYKTLGFESWMDSEIADMYLLREAQPAEFLKLVKQFKKDVVIAYEQDTSIYFLNYVKYSMGLNVDHIKYLGSPSINDKFFFYLDSLPVLYHHDKYMEYVNLFFNRYYYNLSSENRKAIYDAIIRSDAETFLYVLSRDLFLKNRELRELVALKILSEGLTTQEFPKSNIASIIEILEQIVVNDELRLIAKNLRIMNNELKIGFKINDFKLNESISFYLYEGKHVYMHFFDPKNQKCLSEISILKKLNEKYGNQIQFVTIYQNKKEGFSQIDKRNLDAIIWDKFGLDASHPIWNELKVNTFPYYLLFDPNLVLISAPALAPSPNGKYETIEKTMYDIKREIENR